MENEFMPSISTENKKNNLGIRLLVWLIGIIIISYVWFNNGMQLALTKGIIYVILLFCLSKGLKEGNLFNPYFMYSIVPFSLLIHNEQVSETYMLRLYDYTYIFAILNMLTFLIAISYTKGCNEKEEVGLDTPQQLFWHGWFMFGLSLLGFVITPLVTFLDLFKYIAIACVMKGKKYFSAILMVVIVIAVNADSLHKTMILSLSIVILMCYTKYYMKKELTAKFVIFIGVAAVLMVIMFTLKSYIANGGTIWEFITGGYYDNDIRGYYTSRKDVNWTGPEELFLPYMYLTTPWTNLQVVLFTQRDHTYGLWMLKPLFGWLQMDVFFKHLYKMSSYSTFNTFTYLGVLFKDFGYIGSCIGSAVIGIFVKRIYNRFRKSTSPLDVAAYALVAQATAEMFFSNHFFEQSYPFVIIIDVMLYRFLIRTLTPKKEE